MHWKSSPGESKWYSREIMSETSLYKWTVLIEFIRKKMSKKLVLLFLRQCIRRAEKVDCFVVLNWSHSAPKRNIINPSLGISVEPKKSYLKHSTQNEIPLNLPLLIQSKRGPFHAQVRVLIFHFKLKKNNFLWTVLVHKKASF